MDQIDTTATVSTAERVWFRYRIAGPAQRGAAYLVDLLIQGSLVTAVVLAATALSLVPGFSGIGLGGLYVSIFLITWLYGVLFEALLGGRTPGKMALELRVVRTDGAPARFPDLVLRNLVRAADFLPFGFALGVLVMVFDSRFRRLGDLVAGTVVVSESRAAMLGSVRIEPPVSEEERQALPAGVELRPEELEVIEAFLRRRRSLSNDRAAELAEQFGPALSARTGIQAASWERVLALAYARATGRDR